MRILVTGATGFVGSHVVRALEAAGHTVRALVRPAARRDAVGATRVEWVTGDVLDLPSLEAAADGCEAVVHVAAHLSFRPDQFARQREVNVQGTRNVLEAARAAKVKRFVHTSSVAAVGRGAPGTLADESTRYDWPVGFHYNESKRDAEAVVRSARDIETVCLNPALVVGPNEVGARALPLFRAVRAGLMMVAPPGGTTLCDVRDVAAAHVAALVSGRAGERYILGGPHVTFREGLRLVADEVGGQPARVELPGGAVRVGALSLVALERLGVPLPWSPRYAGYLLARTFYSSEKAMSELDYHTRPAAESIRDAASWYRAAGAL